MLIIIKHIKNNQFEDDRMNFIFIKTILKSYLKSNLIKIKTYLKKSKFIYPIHNINSDNEFNLNTKEIF